MSEHMSSHNLLLLRIIIAEDKSQSERKVAISMFHKELVSSGSSLQRPR